MWKYLVKKRKENDIVDKAALCRELPQIAKKKRKKLNIWSYICSAEIRLDSVRMVRLLGKTHAFDIYFGGFKRRLSITLRQNEVFVQFMMFEITSSQQSSQETSLKTSVQHESD